MCCRLVLSLKGGCVVVEQLFDGVSSTYTYLLADLNSREAVVIDPVLDLAERDANLIRDLQFTLKYASEFKDGSIYCMVNQSELLLCAQHLPQ